VAVTAATAMTAAMAVTTAVASRLSGRPAVRVSAALTGRPTVGMRAVVPVATSTAHREEPDPEPGENGAT
jgi:hypothetical protein